MKETILFSLALIGSVFPAYAQQPTYCNTAAKCRADGGRVSKNGQQCLYSDGQVKSFVWICDAQNPNRSHYGPTEEDPNAPYEGPYNGDHD